MGCFLGCFGSSNDQKRKRQKYKVILRDQKPKIQNVLKADASLGQNITNSFPEPREQTEVPVPLSLKRRKKVTFDTNVTTYEHIEVYDSTESLLEKNEKSETYPKSAQTLSDSDIKENITNYRYGNCVESDDEFEDLDQQEYDLDDHDDDDDDDDLGDEEHYDGDEVEEKSSVWDSIHSDKNTHKRNGYVLSVFSPVENITQWQALKSRGRAQKPLSCKGQKEKLSLNKETAVDSSLSNWLITSEINTRNKKPIC